MILSVNRVCFLEQREQIHFCNGEVLGTGVAQSVQCLTTGWTTGVPFQSEANNFSSSLSVQTGSEAHPHSYPMGTGCSFPGAKERLGRDADHSPHLVPNSRMSRSYISSPSKRLYGV
jgi:hypothetical protein